MPEGAKIFAPMILFSMMSDGKFRASFCRLEILRCPAQWFGFPAWLCSSQTRTLVPNFVAVYAETEPQGPAPTTTMSGVVIMSVPRLIGDIMGGEVLKDSIYKRAVYYTNFLEVLL